MLRRLSTIALASISVSGFGADYRPARKDLGFAVYSNAPSGRQLSGQHAPASTPALSPEAAQRQFTVPEGFEIRLFASEPEVVNPVAMTWDERGRLWVVELYEYPLGAKPGEKPRDRIKILEDTDADGRADKVHVWADGLNLATAILLGHGGAFVGQAPDLLFLRDTDGDDRADTTEVVKTGFGLEDRHELLNGFTWGPDGQMYMTHGVFTRSKVVAPNQPADDPILLTAGVARLNLQTRKFEIYAEGTSNPWGVDFDRTGNAYVSACVIEHLFHLVPGGLYDRQAGTPPHPYAYELLHAINDHKHHMAAYAGIQVYQGNQFPADNAGTILQGNIHDNAVHQDTLQPKGSSFIASHWRDLVRANDGWFMPVSTQVGPDGAVWIMDWYDRYPCYQNANADPSGVDREHGRVWRVVHTGSNQGQPVPSRPDRDMNLARLTTAELSTVLAHSNVWHRRMAQRLLNERRDDKVVGLLQNLFATGRSTQGAPSDGSAPSSAGRSLDTRLAALWTLYSSGYLADDVLARAARDSEPAIRAWAARFIGERQVGDEADIERLTALARDPDPSVRLAVAVACRQFTSSHLTVNRPPTRENVPVGRALVALLETSAKADDPVIPFMLWHAAEPLIARRPANALNQLADEGHRFLPLAGQFAAKTMRRLCDLGDAGSMDLAVAFIQRALPNSVPMTEAALDGLIAGQAGKSLTPSQGVGPFIAALSAHPSPAIALRGQKLGALWGDAAALRAVLQVAGDTSATSGDRVRAIQTARATKNIAARDAMLAIVGTPNPEPVQIAAIDALGELGGNEIADDLIGRWSTLSAGARSAAASALASRRRWALPLLAEVKAGRISVSDFGPAVVRNLVNNRDDDVRQEAKIAIGRFRESGADKAALVAAKRKVALAAEPDLDAGHEVAQRVCLVCHKLLGEGQAVGPDLTGVGRSSLDSLLWNIFDPNQVIGAGYEQVEVETKDDRVVAGRLVEDTDARVGLLLIGGKEEVIGKGDIKNRRTLEGSVMPEGLGEMPDADLRNMLWYILAPPQEGPLTKEKRERLGAGGHAAASQTPAADLESVALWNPEWRLAAPPFEGTPAKLPEYHGRANVLRTHPFTSDKAAALERTLVLPADRTFVLRVTVAAHDQGDWKLRILADGKPIHETVVDHASPRWRTVSVDLKPFAGRQVNLRLENAANDWSWEFGYWADVKIEEAGLASR